MSGRTHGDRNDSKPALNAISTPKVCVSSSTVRDSSGSLLCCRPPAFGERLLEIRRREELWFAVLTGTPRNAPHDAFDDLHRRVGIVDHRELPLVAIGAF